MYIDITQIKSHLNIDSDFLDDDEYLLHLESVAELVVQKHIDHRLEDLLDESGQLPAPLIQGMLLFIGNLYANRESVSYASAVEVPNSFEYLLSLYKDYNNTKMDS